ncbi:MAG: adenylate cyclase [Acidobacteriaceae bacterium]|nr:adenylate cyclase [Acidobacteriaceae bacterium]
MPGSASNEVEIKFRLTGLGGLVARLRQLGFQQVTPRTHEMNVLFDLPGHPLRDRGDVLRLRKYGELWVLTHKTKNKNDKKDGPHKTRIETETRVENGEKMEAILRAVQFEPSFRYEKFRAEWKAPSGEGYVVIDETPIGNFAEIEGPPEWIDSLARDLQIDRTQYITETYAGLFLAWRRENGSNAQEMTFEAIGSGQTNTAE